MLLHHFTTNVSNSDVFHRFTNHFNHSISFADSRLKLTELRFVSEIFLRFIKEFVYNITEKEKAFVMATSTGI